MTLRRKKIPPADPMDWLPVYEQTALETGDDPRIITIEWHLATQEEET